MKMSMKTRMPNRAVLDGDIIAYKAAYWADYEGIEDLPSRIAHDIKEWTPPDTDSIIIAKSCSRSDNFRRKVWSKYKANREEKAPPASLDYAWELIENEYTICSIPHIEADDILGMAASSGKAVSVTIDKDLRNVPGWQWNPNYEDFPMYVSEKQADIFFTKQLVTGDPTDGIPGLPNKGETFFNKHIQPFSWVSDRVWEIWWAYEEMGYDMEYFLSQARSVRILRHGEYDKETGDITLWNLPDRYEDV